MELTQAIRSRKSIRGYKPNPVPKEVLRQLLELATRSPSSLNIQSWEFIVLAGEPLHKLKQAVVDEFSSGATGQSDLVVEAPTGIYRERQVALAKELFRLLDIAREDREKRNEWVKKGLRFYDAPAAIIIAVDESAPNPWRIFDVALITQTIALAAQEFGLGTCIQRQAVDYPHLVRRITGIPDSKKLIIGLSIGYPDPDFPANKLVSEREPLEKLITWCGL